MLAMINAFRTGSEAWYWNKDNTTKTTCSNLSELSYDYNLEKLAMQRAAEIALSYSHTRPDNNTCWTVYDDYGYTWYAVSENIAAGQTSAAAVFKAWQETDEYYDDQGHRRNMLSDKVTAVGIGHVTYDGTEYWVQVFANLKTGSNTTETQPNDGETTVSIKVADSLVKSATLTVDPTSYSLSCDDSDELPTMTAELTMNSTWVQWGRSTTRNVTIASPTWSSSDTGVVTVDNANNKVTAEGAGSTTLTASALGKTASVSVTVSHGTTVLLNAKDATCTENGYTGDEVCTDCGATITAGTTTPATGHTFGEPTFAWSENYSTATATFTCQTCGETDTVAAAVTDSTENATCTETGKTVYTATVNYNGNTYTDEQTVTIAATGHSYESVVTAPTCTEGGYTTYTCSVCRDSYTADETAATGHNYESEITTAATCTTTGVITYTCKTCGETYTETIAATGHSYDEGVVTTAPTCTKAGVKTYTCSVCQNTYTEEIAATGHSYDEGVVTTEPTCTEAGVKTYTCSVCRDTYTDTISATDHSYVSVVTDPTCTEKGYTTYTCSVCNDSYVADETEAKGHTYDSVVTKEATEDEEGEITYTCTVCGATYTDTIPIVNHNFGNPTFSWNEDYSVVKAIFACVDTGCSYTIEQTAQVAAQTTNSTCTADGQTVYTATVIFNGTTYSDTRTKTLPATGHDYVATVTAPTCTEKGYTTYTCSVCKDTYTADETDATGHDYVATVTAPTCTEKGYTTYTCSVCGDTYTADETDATGHNYVETITKDATCTEDGVKTFTCSDCGDSYTETIPATGHDYDDGVVTRAAGCNIEGVMTYTCKNCGNTYTEDIPTIPHTMAVSAVLKAATCTEDGILTCVCGACHQPYTEVIPATGHTYTEVVTKPTCTEKGYTTYTCSDCGDSYTANETNALGHTWNAGVVTKEATEDEAGVRTYTCTVCGATYTQEIAAIGHVDDDTEDDTTEDDTTVESTADDTAAAASEPIAVESAVTGDDSPLAALAIVLLLAAAGIVGLTVVKRKKAC